MNLYPHFLYLLIDLGKIWNRMSPCDVV